MSLEKYVLPGVCLHCGAGSTHGAVTWTPEKIIQAAQRETEERGRPPRANEWQHAGPDHPAQSTVSRVFGRWNVMLAAAGIELRPRAYHPPTHWTKERIAEAMLDYLFRTGEWPSEEKWKRGHVPGEPKRPSAHTVRRIFKSWVTAKRFAGWRTPEELETASQNRLAALERSHAKRRAARRAPGSPPEAPLPSSRTPRGTPLEKPSARRNRQVTTARTDERTVAA